MENVFINLMTKKGFTHHEALLFLRVNNVNVNINSYIELAQHVKTLISSNKEGIIKYFRGCDV